MWPDTKEKVELELAQLQRLVDAHGSLIEKVADSEPDTIELSALSAYLHSFYNGIENIFKQVAADIDGGCLTASRWHAELLESMTTRTAQRPAVITEALREKLVRYMGFRHVFQFLHFRPAVEQAKGLGPRIGEDTARRS